MFYDLPEEEQEAIRKRVTETPEESRIRHIKEAIARFTDVYQTAKATGSFLDAQVAKGQITALNTELAAAQAMLMVAHIEEVAA